MDIQSKDTCSAIVIIKRRKYKDHIAWIAVNEGIEVPDADVALLIQRESEPVYLEHNKKIYPIVKYEKAVDFFGLTKNVALSNHRTSHRIKTKFVATASDSPQ